MSDEDDFFADVEVAEVTVSTAKNRTERSVTEAWRLYVSLTSRPDGSKVDREFARVYRELLRENDSHDLLLRVIRGAALTRPRPRDPRDVRRVTSALRTASRRTTALALLRESESGFDRPVYPYPRPDYEAKASIGDLEDALGTFASDWTSRDLEAAGLLVAELDADELIELADSVSLSLGLDTILPVDLLRNLRTARSGKVVSRADRDSYHAGAAEQAALSGLALEADADAERALVRGVPAADIAAFHFLAPTGYWQAVLDQSEDDPGASLASIYVRIEAKYGWHPDNRPAILPTR